MNYKTNNWHCCDGVHLKGSPSPSIATTLWVTIADPCSFRRIQWERGEYFVKGIKLYFNEKVSIPVPERSRDKIY